jgi:hypothetical protein
VSGFRAVELRGSGTVRVTQGTREGLRIEAEDNILPLIEARVDGETLTLGFRDESASIHATKPILFEVSLRELTALALPGSGFISAPNVRTGDLRVGLGGSGQITLAGLSAGTLRAQLSGTGTITATGRVTSQHVSIPGTGIYLSPQLASREAEVTLAGSGTAVVRMSDRLHAEIGGTGAVHYIGNPVVEQTITGVGTITQQSAG